MNAIHVRRNTLDLSLENTFAIQSTKTTEKLLSSNMIKILSLKTKTVIYASRLIKKKKSWRVKRKFIKIGSMNLRDSLNNMSRNMMNRLKSLIWRSNFIRKRR